MRLQRYLTEKYHSRISPKHLDIYPSVEVFVNPSQKEIREAGGASKEVRFIADSQKKKLYIWSGVAPVLHHEASKEELKLGNLCDGIESLRLLSGYADQKGGKWRMYAGDGADCLDDAEYTKGMDVIIQTFDWVNKYIDITGFFNLEHKYK